MTSMTATVLYFHCFVIAKTWQSAILYHLGSKTTQEMNLVYLVELTRMKLFDNEKSWVRLIHSEHGDADDHKVSC